MKAALKVFSTRSAFEWDNEDFSDDNDNNNDEDNGWLDMSYIKDDNDEEYIETLKPMLSLPLTILSPHAALQDSAMKDSVKRLKKETKMGHLVKKVYAWSHSSVIWTLGGPPHISWLTVFLSCIQYVAFFNFFFQFFLNI